MEHCSIVALRCRDLFCFHTGRGIEIPRGRSGISGQGGVGKQSVLDIASEGEWVLANLFEACGYVACFHGNHDFSCFAIARAGVFFEGGWGFLPALEGRLSFLLFLFFLHVSFCFFYFFYF